MKALLATALFTALMASSAHAEGLQFETRAFHTNLRIHGNTATQVVDGRQTFTADVDASYYNSAGFGVNAVYGLNDAFDLGLGVSHARYYPDTETRLDQTVANGFLRYNLVKSSAGKIYFMAGVSRQMLSQNMKDTDDVSWSARITPVGNVDGGIGGALTLGAVDLGLEYKYSNSVGRAHGTFKETQTSVDEAGLVTTEVGKTRFSGLKVEAQELALTVGMKL